MSMLDSISSVLLGCCPVVIDEDFARTEANFWRGGKDNDSFYHPNIREAIWGHDSLPTKLSIGHNQEAALVDYSFEADGSIPSGQMTLGSRINSSAPGMDDQRLGR